MIRTNWSHMNGKKRKHNDQEPDIVALLNTLTGGKAEVPSGLGLGNNNENKLYSRNNHIYFQDEINFDTASALIKMIDETATDLKFMQKEFDLTEPPSIKLHLTSGGGIVHSAFMIIDAMEACEVPVDTIINGFGASSCTLISIHGARRYISKNAVMLIHQCSSGSWGTEAEQLDNFANLAQMSEKIKQMYADHTTMTKAQLKEILKHDLDWNADKALKTGLVDEIL